MTNWIRIGFTCTVLLATGCGGGTNPQPTVTAGDPIRNFVTPTYVHGVPYAKALQLGPGAVTQLVNMLDEPAMVSHRANIATTLGILGTKEAENRLVELVQSGSGPLRHAEVQVRLVALSALGYAVNVPEPGDKLRYLIDGLQAAAWTSIDWRLPSGDSPVNRLRERAIAALGLSGRPEALGPLAGLLTPPGGGGGRGGGGAQPPDEAALVGEALRNNTLIHNVGLIEYYKAIDSREP